MVRVGEAYDADLISPKTMQEKTLKEKLDSIDEYEREPVPKDKVKGFKSFVGMVAGEHIAGTEFVIGPLFVLHGAGYKDIFLGLLVGNLLATLSWTLICAPAAVKTRTTIFYQLERICGTNLVNIYNVINAILFCVGAASMIAVSATAIGLLFDFPMPGMQDFLPTGIGWVLTVFAVGSVIAAVATFGYDQVSNFANIFAPWMPLVFLAAAISVLPELGVSTWSEFWVAADEKIWTGIAKEGKTKFGFWHIMFFSWLCNTSMHIGMGDMSIYRYAKKAHYGLASAAGMFIGHYMAWIASGILCAVILLQGEDNPSPGQIAFYSAGLAGAICVVIAGWTTSNPTIYRAGLAVQAMFPNVKRWKITLVIGAISTCLACFPGVISYLGEILGYFALVAAPVGAVVLIDIYLLPKLGLQDNYSERNGNVVNWAVALTWVLSIGACVAILFITEADFAFFMALPGWFIGAVLYILFSKVFQSKSSKS